MKILLAAVFVAFAAAGAYAFDLGGIFSGCGKPAAIKDLAVKEVPAAPAPTAEPGERDYPLNIKPGDARRYIELQRPVVIDIRRPEEYAAGHLEAVNLQLDYYAPDFKDKLAGLDKKASHLIYCRSGHRSGLTLAI
ncbi:MAG: rhodanese-like domain-containing protein, partial [Elusimicrobiota bacterium]|nr:rhodanese-like domain-containing protein [Elusimicrobiota bacterium]